ncbi:MAG: HD-GYP domain-containing protein [Lachnospiraceae bacterium]|nr:HD-GYP domain-containing protein [Lachnospiraceae bacterium]
MAYLRSIFNRKSIFWFVCALVLWLALFIDLVISVRSENSSFSYSFAGDSDRGSLPVDVSIKVSQSWDDYIGDVQIKGAEYDGTVVNGSGKEIRNWILTIKLPESDGQIDSSWNGTYEKTGNAIDYYPDKNVYVIEKDSFRTFGFILKSAEVYNDFAFDISGQYVTYKEDYPMYWAIVYITIAYAVAFIMYASMQIKMEMRRRSDDEIIRQTMMVFVNSIDARDEYTKGHSVRVSEYASALAKEMGYSDDEVRKIGYIALLHDCGKIMIPGSVLKKPGKLTEEEKREIRQHTVMGGKMLEGFTSLDGAREGALYHHEYYNGEGYPEGLKGEEIPKLARIICVADSFDAMNSDRCYRKHLGRERIVEELKRNKGVQFDPTVAECMLKLIETGKVHVME